VSGSGFSEHVILLVLDRSDAMDVLSERCFRL
jgi:hypothetical protein